MKEDGKIESENRAVSMNGAKVVRRQIIRQERKASGERGSKPGIISQDVFDRQSGVTPMMMMMMMMMMIIIITFIIIPGLNLILSLICFIISETRIPKISYRRKLIRSQIRASCMHRGALKEMQCCSWLCSVCK